MLTSLIFPTLILNVKGEYETFENSSKNDFGIRAEAA
jgi:hypothetical protein